MAINWIQYPDFTSLNTGDKIIVSSPDGNTKKVPASAITSSVDTLQEITDNGNTTTNSIMIGSSASPSEKLHIDGGKIFIKHNTTEQYNYQYNDSQPVWSFGGGNYFTIKKAGTRLFNLTSGGDLGLGVTGPSKRLHVYDTTSGIARLETNQTYSDVELKTNNGTAYVSARDGHVLLNRTGGNNVGINTDSPTEKLHVVGDALITGDSHADAFKPAVSGNPIKFKNFGSTELARITDGGNFGINTSSPNYTFHSNGISQLYDAIFWASGGSNRLDFGLTNEFSDANLIIKNNGLGKNFILEVEESDGTDVRFLTYSTSDSKLFLKNKLNLEGYGSGSFTGTETYFLAVTSGGDVVEADSSALPGGPYLPLSGGTLTGGLTGPSGTFGTLKITTGLGSAAELQFTNAGAGLYRDSGNLVLAGYDNIVFKSSNDVMSSQSERMRLTSDGRVGIGLSNPSFALDVDSGTANAAFRVLSTDRYTGIRFEDSLSNDILFYDGQNDLMFLGSTSFRAVNLTATGTGSFTGNVGIGTTSPGAKLEVSSDSNVATIINSTSTFTFIDIENDGANRVQVGNASDGDFIVRTDELERVRVTSGGNLLLGTTTDSGEKLVLSGNQRINAGEFFITESGSSRKPVRLHKSDYKGAITIQRDGDANVNISSDGANLGQTYFDGNGVNVGIKTRTPTANLHVSGTTTLGTNLGKIDIVTTGATVAEGPAMVLDGRNLTLGSYDNGRFYVGIKQTHTNNTTNDDTIQFICGDSERMRLTSDGKLGIGVSSPHTLLNLNDNNVAGEAQFGIGDISSYYLAMGHNSAGNTDGFIGTVYNNDAARFDIRMKGTAQSDSKVTVLGSGNVGIGTSSPSAKLHVYGTSNPIFRIEDNGGAYGFFQAAGSNLVYLGSGPGADLNIYAGLSNAMTILASNRNVGIGTSSPQELLHLFKQSHSNPLLIEVENDGYLAGTSAGIKLTSKATDGVSGSWTIDNLNRDTLRFLDDGSEKMRLTSDGKLLLNTTSSITNELFQVDGSGYFSSHIYVQGGVRLPDSVGSSPALTFNNDTTIGLSRYTTNTILITGDLRAGNVVLTGSLTGTNATFNGNVFSETYRSSRTDGDVYIQAATASDFVAIGTQVSGQANLMRVLGNGNVLIGTTSDDGYKLNVNGNVRIGQNDRFYINNANVGLRRDSNDLVLGGYGGIRFLSSSTDISNQTERMRILSNGNVGIGTASPSHKLTVSSSNNTTAVGIDIGSSANFDFAANSSSGYSTLFYMDDVGLDIGHNSTARAINFKTGSADRLTITGGGNVLIGTTTDSGAKLNVNGTILCNNELQFTNSAMRIFRSSDDMRFRTNNTDKLTITSGGNVGIGTSSPSQGLHVVDSGIITSEFESSNNSSSLIEVSNNAGLDAFFGVYGGNLVLRLDDYTANHFSMDSNGNATFSGTLELSNGTLNSTTARLSLKSEGSYVHLKSNNNVIYYDATSHLFRDNSGSEKMRLTSTGLGIGTSSPSEKLDVSGNVLVGGGTLSRWLRFKRTDGFQLGFGEILSNGELKIGGTNVGVISFYRSAGEVMRINGANVGIGTTSPGEKLHVGGNVKIEGANPYITLTDTTNPNYCEIKNIDGNLDLQADKGNQFGNSRIRFYLDSTEKMTLNNSGLGIGTISPTHKLEVRGGDTHFENTSSTNTFLDVKGTSANAYIRAYSDSNSVWLYQGGSSSYLSAQSGSTLRLNSGSSNLILLDSSGEVMRSNNGNVLIGTTTLTGSSKLQVNGDITLPLNNNIRFGTQLALQKESNGEFNFYGGTNSTNGGFDFKTWTGSAYTTSFLIRNSGNLLIGTTTDDGSNKLQVNGSAKISDTDGSVAISGGNINLTDSGGGTMVALDSSTGDGVVRWKDNNVQKWDMGRDNTDQAFVIANEAGLNDNQVVHINHSTGEFTLKGDLTIGEDDTGYDVTFYGDTSGEYLQWDASDDSLEFRDNVKAKFGNSGDFHILRNATDSFLENSFGHIFISNSANDKDIRLATDDGTGGITNYIVLDGSQATINLYKTVLIGTTTNTGAYKIDVAGKQRVQDTLELDDVLMLNQISTPADPADGKSVIYMDSADGGIKCKINVGGTVVTRTLAAFE